MKVVKPSFESVLDELDRILIRTEEENGVRSLVAGGLNKEGVWVEYASALSPEARLPDIIKPLRIMVLLIAEENKRWELEKPHHWLLREVAMCEN
ncbi:MAG: hypothetical protein AAGA66_02535 [Bacteroidota bacterium]